MKTTKSEERRLTVCRSKPQYLLAGNIVSSAVANNNQTPAPHS